MGMLLNNWFMACNKEDDFVIIRPPLFVYIAQTGFPLGTDLSKGKSKILNEDWPAWDG